MYYQQSCAAKGKQGNMGRPMLIRSKERAAVNIYRTDNSYELLVFAPGRIKEHFHINVEGRELKVSYTPPEGFPRPEWVLREYSRGGFVRSFTLDGSINVEGITARYEDGVLYVSLPFAAEQQASGRTIAIA